MTPRAWRTLAVLALTALACGARMAPAAPAPSPLAMPRLAPGDRPELLAQRVIERSWGPSEDSVYKVVNVPDWKSEGIALGLSAAIPGAGQTYVGERSGLLFLALEVSGWTARSVFVHDARRLRTRAAGIAGAPGDSASGWSAERWSQATGRDPSDIERLYAADREAYFDAIGKDATYAAGWQSPDLSGQFTHLRSQSNDDFGRGRWAGIALFLNHVLSAADALKAARLHNIPLERNMEIQLRGAWRGGPGFAAIVERRF